ncbi:hypothetical protein [Dehalobacter sp. TeCB1]|uniref:hypothetical protein n=1 Tax=Dehalobacter sp. TeCB1 TaxID=1843715 RepID=UPI00159F2AD5|nr:hypothetical protein [Dehalobacter sp. TeCB1]
MKNVLKELLNDERGDLTQEIILLIGGILATVGLAMIIFGTVKSKVTNDSTGISVLN